MTENDIKQLIIEVDRLATVRTYKLIHEHEKAKLLAKPQITRQEIVTIFDEATYNSLIKKWGLKPARQNGKGSKIYFKTSRVLDLTEKSIHM